MKINKVILDKKQVIIPSTRKKPDPIVFLGKEQVDLFKKVGEEDANKK